MNRNVLSLGFVVLSAWAAAVHAEGRKLTVDDFEDGDRRAASGLSWISIADDLMGGASFADLEVTGAGGGSGRALRVSGEVAADGFAGAWVALDGGARATDVSDFKGLRLRVRGPGALKVLLRGGPGAGFNYAAPVESRADWTTVEVPFQALTAARPGSPAFDPRTVRWLGVGVSANRAGRYEFAIDDGELYAARDRQARGRSWPGTRRMTASRSACPMRRRWPCVPTSPTAGSGSGSPCPDRSPRGGWA